MKRYVGLSIAALIFASRASLAQTERPLDPIAAQMEPTRRLVYKTVGERPLHLDVFEPAGHQPGDRCAVFLMIHGGGWVGGSVRRTYPFAEHFAKRGVVGVGLEYRLLDREQGTTVFDAAQDARSAVRYLRHHANELGIDPQRIVAAGASAGAHLAAGTAMFDGIDSADDDTTISCRPDALVLYYPVIDTSGAGYGQQKIGPRWRELSPVDQVRAGLPPTILFHGTADTVTPYSGAAAFHQRMIDAGNTCELVSHPSGRHGYLIFDLTLYEQALSRTCEFLKEQQMME